MIIEADLNIHELSGFVVIRIQICCMMGYSIDPVDYVADVL